MFTSREAEPDEGTGAIIGGESLFGRIALMRVKLNLTNEEVMNSSWISLQLQMYDYPYFDTKAKKIIKGEQARLILDKYVNK